MYKVERMISSTEYWYEVMLSPFESWDAAVSYIQKYRHYYPHNEQNYKVTFQRKDLAVP